MTKEFEVRWKGELPASPQDVWDAFTIHTVDFVGKHRQAVADAHRREWAYVLAATVRVTRDLDAAEEAMQDA